MAIRIGDLVTRKSYQCDMPFRVTAIHEEKEIAELAGRDWRLYADAPFEDLVFVNADERQQFEREIRQKEDASYKLFRQDYDQMRLKYQYRATNGYRADISFFEMPGRVLHVDGDPYYLKKCLNVYRRLSVPAIGKYMVESEMAARVPDLVAQIRPDILVLTGHDAFLKNKGSADELKAYRHSAHFVRAVKEVRFRWPSLDQLNIFAGACQSNFERLIRAGANFASSPDRVNIHALDPVYLVSKISFSSFMESVNVWDVLRNTLSGSGSIGGVESRGMMRTGMPYPAEDGPYSQ